MGTLKLLVILASSTVAASVFCFKYIFSSSSGMQFQHHQLGSIDDKVFQAITEAALINQENVSTLRASGYSLTPGTTYKRIVIASETDAGSAYLTAYLSRHPGVYLAPDPLSRTKVLPKVIPSLNIPDAYDAAEILVNVLNCEHKSWMEASRDWPVMYWWSTNAHLMPQCQDWKANTAICLNATFINGVCAVSPIKVVTVNTDQMYAFNLGRVLYDPWLSKDTKIVVVTRDPRAVMHDRLVNPDCNDDNCRLPIKMCTRMRMNQRKSFGYVDFTPTRFKIVRHEDLVLGKQEVFDNLLAFLGLEAQPYMDQYVASQKPLRTKDPYEVFPWMKAMSFANVAGVQSKCTEVMRFYGYNVIKERTQMSKTSPIEESLPDYEDLFLKTF